MGATPHVTPHTPHHIRYGLGESEGGYRTRDIENAAMADACVGFLCTKPKTGKGAAVALPHAPLASTHRSVSTALPAVRSLSHTLRSAYHVLRAECGSL